MRKYIFVTNIPTPYRNSFYNDLNSHGFNFEVYYERFSEDDRSWDVKNFDTYHDYYIDKGFYWNFGYYHLHINPALVLKLVLSRDCEFIFGLNWNDLNLIILVVLKYVGLIRNKFHFWSEANYLTLGARRDNLFKYLLRRFVFNSADGSHIISGQMTKVTLKRWGISPTAHVQLPNTIQEDKFLLTGNEFSERAANAKLSFIMPVRLIESIKGFLNFFTAIGPDNINENIFFVAGEGPDLNLLNEFISKNSLDRNIIVLGQLSSDMLRYYYSIANVFLLPSFSDPAPLSVFEAMSMGLPLLLSNRCGNHYEALKDGLNGFIFDPSSHLSIRNSFLSIVKNKSSLSVMGAESLKIYTNTLRKHAIIDQFITQMNGLQDCN